MTFRVSNILKTYYKYRTKRKLGEESGKQD